MTLTLQQFRVLLAGAILLAAGTGATRASYGAPPVPVECDEDRRAGISFLPPVDFATNATPGVTAAFNAAAGDQTALLIAGGVAGTPLLLLDSVAVGDFDHDRDLDVAQ